MSAREKERWKGRDRTRLTPPRRTETSGPMLRPAASPLRMVVMSRFLPSCGRKPWFARALRAGQGERTWRC